ncbi:hypothetical protein AB0J82_27480 [Asanoa sp. NPDC049518]|uniref:hypothetical protein n=1 Tax=unclassified Asanoa TaxID=2685164 RepID=UPI00341748FD
MKVGEVLGVAALVVFVLLGIVERRHVLAVLHTRIISVWDAIEPFVVAERALGLPAGNRLLCHLEAMARLAKVTPEAVVDDLLTGKQTEVPAWRELDRSAERKGWLGLTVHVGHREWRVG